MSRDFGKKRTEIRLSFRINTHILCVISTQNPKSTICTLWFYSVLLVRAITQLRAVPLATTFSAYSLISLKLRATALNASFVFVTLEQSRVLSGLSPPLQISHRVVPKPHLSVAKLRFWGFSMHSGGTQGIRSTNTDEEKRTRNMNKLI